MNLRIRELREQSNLYQRNLAEYLGCTQQTYSRYETAELEPSLVVLEKLALFYETSVDYIMGLTDIKMNNWNENSSRSEAAEAAIQKRNEIFRQPKVKRGRKPKEKPAE